MSTAELSPFAPSCRLNDEARDDALLEARARHDEGLDGGARKLGEHERRGVHRAVVVPKRFQLRALCDVESLGVTVSPGVSRDLPRRASPQQKKTRDRSSASILRSLRQNKTRQRKSAILKLLDILVRHGTAVVVVSAACRVRRAGRCLSDDETRGV
jgi:hypothetical protein